MKLVVSTCGTSTLTNLATDSERKLVTQYANASSPDDVPLDDRRLLIDLIASASDILARANLIDTKRASAELNGILSYANDRVPLDTANVCILLHTDTWLGEKAASIISDKLQSFGVTPQIERVKDLNTRSRQTFDDGLRNLIDWASITLPGYRDAKYHIAFNLVGGFKSVQGFMQSLGMFYADEIVYIFESGSELLRIPRLPVNLDAAARTLFETHHAIFRLFSMNQPISSTDVRLKPLPETFLYHDNGECDWSPWGKLLWEQFKIEFYKQGLLPSPTDSIRLTDTFKKDAGNLQPDRSSILNQRIDDLARYLLDESNPNPKRLDVKPLKRDPKPPSTHEADAWADADCLRIFFHYERGVAVLNRLDKPLH